VKKHTLAAGRPPLTVAINELGRRADMSIMLQNHATRMTALTLGQMNAVNRRP
jgi:hypothetical protein